MGIHRVMVTIENVSGLPRDRFVNTWHFGTGGAVSAEAMALAESAFFDFYRGPSGSGGVMSLYSPIVANTAGHSIKWYDLANPPKSPPVRTTNFAPGTAPTGSPLPNELSICLSLYAGQNVKRHRGRVYLGPFRSSVLDSVSAEGDAKIAASSVTLIKDRAQALINALNPGLTIFSRVDGVARQVTDGWVDNAWDIQRRRGAKATSRSTFT